MILGIIAGLAVVGVVCFFTYLTYVAQHSPSIIRDGDNNATADARWVIEDIGGTDTDEPITRVTLRDIYMYNPKTYFSSIYSGSCSIVDKSNLEVNQISGVTCWWAGGGNKAGLFKENGVFVIKEGLMDEGNGGDGGFDKWVTTKEIKL